jgi:hypothetical protein
MMMKEGRLLWAGHVVRMAEMRKPEGKKSTIYTALYNAENITRQSHRRKNLKSFRTAGDHSDDEAVKWEGISFFFLVSWGGGN